MIAGKTLKEKEPGVGTAPNSKSVSWVLKRMLAWIFLRAEIWFLNWHWNLIHGCVESESPFHSHNQHCSLTPIWLVSTYSSRRIDLPTQSCSLLLPCLCSFKDSFQGRLKVDARLGTEWHLYPMGTRLYPLCLWCLLLSFQSLSAAYVGASGKVERVWREGTRILMVILRQEGTKPSFLPK